MKAPPETRASRRRRWPWIGLALALALAAGLWWARDLPRRTLESILADRLGAEVRVGSAQLAFSGEVRLGDVEVTRIASEPRLERLHVAELVARGSWRRMWRGEFEALELRGLTGHLTPAEHGRDEAAIARASVLAKRARIHDARFTVRDTATVIRLEAVLRDLGSDTHGYATLRAQQAELSSILALIGLAPQPVAAQAAEITLTAELSPKGTLRYEGRGRDVEARGSIGALTAAELRLEGDFEAHETALAGTARLEATGVHAVSAGAVGAVQIPALVARARIETEPRDEHALAVEVELEEPVVGTVRSTVDRKTGRLSHLRAEISDLDLASAFRWWPLRGLDLREGHADVLVEGDPGDDLSVRLEAENLQGAWHNEPPNTALRFGGASLVLEGAVEPRRRVFAGTARLGVRALSGTIAQHLLPAEAAPLQLEASGRVRFAPALAFEGTLRIRTPLLGPLALDGILARDQAQLAADLRYNLDATDLAALLSRAPELLSKLPFAIRGIARASGRLRGPLAAPEIETTAILGPLTMDADVSERPLRLQGKAKLVGSFETARKRGTLQVEIADATFEMPPFAPMRLTGAARAHFEANSSSVDELLLSLEGGRLGRIRGKTSWKSGERLPGRGELEIELGDVGAWLARMAPGRSPIAPGYTIQGQPKAQLSFERSPSGWSAEGPLTLSGFSLTSEDGARVLLGPALKSRAALRYDEEQRSLEAQVEGSLSGFQVLWETLYADYSDLHPKLEARLEVRPTASGEWAASARGKLGLRPSLRAGAWMDKLPGTPARYGFDFEAPDLEELRPYLEPLVTLEALSGAARVRADLGTSCTKWELRARDLDLSLPGQNLELRKLDLELPLHVPCRPGGTPPTHGAAEEGRPLEGSLGWDALRYGTIHFPSARMKLLAEPDRVRLARPLELELFGGRILLEDLAVEHWAEPNRHLRSAVRIEALELARLAPALGLPPLEGGLDGYFPLVRLTRERLRVEGEGELEVFGGRVRLYDIAGEEILSDYPRLEFSADFEEIRLDQLTRTLEFGEITGIARGYVRHCRLFRGVPVRFEGRLETVPRRGVPQKINVKAIHNISILGSGERIGILDRGLHRFFDRYTYARIGIEMKLANDRFLLRGLEHRKGKELFVRGKLPFPIHVVNVAPGQTVSFRTMLERLRNLEVQRGPR